MVAKARLVLLLVALLARCGGAPVDTSVGQPACAQGDPGAQRHGTDCLCCHMGEFGVAGSIAASSAPVRVVVVSDAAGNEAVMPPNVHGNFFQHLALKPPLSARIQGEDGAWSVMKSKAPSGSCNGCHRTGGASSELRAR